MSIRDVHEQASPNEPNPENPGQPDNQDNEPASERSLDKLVTLEDCQTPSSLEPETLQEKQESEKQSQAWAHSPEENPFEVGSEKPQDDSSSEHAIPRSIQKQIFGTDTEISEDESPSFQSIWGDDIKEASPKPEVKQPVLFCPRCKVNSHSQEECTASVIKEANKKALSTGVSNKGKKKITYRRFKTDLELVVMRGKNTDGVQYILEMGDRKEACALYLFLTFGEYTRADRNEVHMSGSREVMDLWRRFSKSMDRTAAEDRLHAIHDQL